MFLARCRYCGARAKLNVAISRHATLLGIAWDIDCSTHCERSTHVEGYFSIKSDECFSMLKRILGWNKRQRVDFAISADDEQRIQMERNETDEVVESLFKFLVIKKD